MDARLALFLELLGDAEVDSFSISKSSRDMYPFRMYVKFRGADRALNSMSMMGAHQCLGQYRDEREKHLNSKSNSDTDDSRFKNYLNGLGIG